MSRHKITYVGTRSKPPIPISYETFPDIPCRTVYQICYISMLDIRNGSTITNSKYLEQTYNDYSSAQKKLRELFIEAISKYSNTFTASFSAMIDGTVAEVRISDDDKDQTFLWRIVETVALGGNEK